MTIARPLLAALLLLLAGAAGGCVHLADDFTPSGKELPEGEGWVQSGTFLCQDFDVLWETAKAKAASGGFRIDDDATTYKGRRIVTTWKFDLAARLNEGKRIRRFVEFREIQDIKDGWQVRVATVRQRNADMDAPFDASQADWRRDDPDPEDAERVAYLVESQFRDYGPSREFEAR